MQQFNRYLTSSLYVFSTCFVIGIVLDNIFKRLTSEFPSHTLLLAFIQLFIVIVLSFVLKKYLKLESYTPHVLFSTFLFSLQSTMINNFRSSVPQPFNGNK